MRKLSPIEVTEIALAYQEGDSLPALAKRYSLHKRTIAEHLLRQGVQPRYTVVSTADLEAAAALYAQGWSLVRIGERLGVNDCTVRRALLKAGVTMRPRKGGRQAHSG